MGFFQDLKQDLSQTVNDLETEDAVGLNLGEEGATASEDLFGEASDTDFADLEAMLEKGVAALGDASVGSLQEESVQTDVDVAAMMETMETMDYAEEAAEDHTGGSFSTYTAVITAGMNITGDVTSSGNMDLIGNITGNIDISGKLNVTGSITGNSAAAEIYAESAQINGEVKSKGNVKIGQSSVVIGNIFATSAVIAGAVKGDIDVHGPVILDTSAIVMGNIKSKSVQINNGAVIEGMCSQCYADVSPSAFFSDVKKNRKQS